MSIADGKSLPGSTWTQQSVFATATLRDGDWEDRRMSYTNVDVCLTESVLPLSGKEYYSTVLSQMGGCLTAKQQRVVTMRREGKTLEEIAAELGLQSTGGVALTLQRAYARLRRKTDALEST